MCIHKSMYSNLKIDQKPENDGKPSSNYHPGNVRHVFEEHST